MAIKKELPKEKLPKHDGIKKSSHKDDYMMTRTVKFGDTVYKRGEKVEFSDELTRKVFLTNNYCT